MNDVSFLKDFYDISRIPVGQTDKMMLLTLNHQQKEQYKMVSHWLIGLVWYESQPTTGWRAFVVPISKDQPFWFLTPYYRTCSLHSFDTALKVSQILEEHSKQDRLTTRHFYEEIEQLTGKSRPKLS